MNKHRTGGQAASETMILTALASLGLFLLGAGMGGALQRALDLWMRAVTAPLP